MTAAGPTRDDLRALGAARRTLYSFLRSAFAEPPKGEQIEWLRNDAWRDVLGGSDAPESLAAFQSQPAPAEQAADYLGDARQEFMSLFKVPGAQYVTPYESVFRDTREIDGRKVGGLLMGQSAIDVQKWYRLAAIEISDAYKDLPDHICLEMDYMAHLCGKEIEFAARGDEKKLTRAWEMQRDFLAGHLARWIDALRDKIHAKTRHAYFRAVADLAAAFVHRDLATLEGVIGESKGLSSPVSDRQPASCA
ncbi:MAG: hypothetical protein D6744_16560 [Planctomycetota bacterium]|nr:MAG: hypothetical protein D6744_16560 [Planctomycetota bacterium]